MATPERGLMLGNRGCLHDLDRRLGVSRWRTKMWLSCWLSFRGRHRDVMPPRRYTALFFLDEVTAMAAGHRPCGECRHADHVAFGEAWRIGHGLEARLRAGEMDNVLHSQRVESRNRRKVTYRASVGSLPDGAMVLWHGDPALVLAGALLPWSFGGYGSPIEVSRAAGADVLTPQAMVLTIEAGYRPYAHPSAGVTSLRTFSSGTDISLRD